ncbi:MAG: electron transfer flavoprotein subunit alpha/FixB family protein [Pseudobdellovibrionaceae bacterium]
MGKILVFAEYANGNLKRGALELLTAAKTSGQTVAALVVGSDAPKMTDSLGKYGATEIHVCKDANLDKYNPELFTQFVSQVLDKVKPDVILASATSLGKDLFPRVAAKTGAGIASDCVGLSLAGGDPKVTKPLFSGKCLTEVEFQNASSKIILMRPNQLPVGEAGGGSGQVTEHSLQPSDLKTLIKEIVKGSSQKLDLTEANVIVSGGRGLKDANSFKILNELADSLGATLGASRAVVDAGWVGHEMQVGQTGKTVAPSLYIAVGISGAIQHLAGMSGSKVIVAINNDPNAPIFQKATYGIVGDAFEVVPMLAAEFKKALHH